MSQAKISNRANAPHSAKFVDAMRVAFGEVKVLYVSEGEVKLGEELAGPFASCLVVAEPERD